MHNLLRIICTVWCNLANVKYRGSACTFNGFAFHATFIMHIDEQIFSHIYGQTRKQTEQLLFQNSRAVMELCTEINATWGFVKLQTAFFFLLLSAIYTTSSENGAQLQLYIRVAIKTGR